MAAVSSSCLTPMVTLRPCFRVDLRHGFQRSLDFGHSRPVNCRRFELEKLSVSASTNNNAVSVNSSVPPATLSRSVLLRILTRLFALRSLLGSYVYINVCMKFFSL